MVATRANGVDRMSRDDGGHQCRWLRWLRLSPVDWNRAKVVGLVATAGVLLAGGTADPGFTLVRRGQPVATVVMATETTRSVELAAEELIDHVRKITGADLPIVRDGARVEGPRILIGESGETRKLGIQSASFRSQEYLIRIRPDTLMLDRSGHGPRLARR